MFAPNLIAGAIGVLLLAAFLGVLVAWLKAVPLIVIVVLVLALLVYDLVRSLRESIG